MRKVKKFAALLLCGALTLTALAGCGGNDGGSKESSSAPAESKAEESKADDAGDAGEAEDAGGEAASGDAVHFTWTAYNCIAGKDYKDPLFLWINDTFGVDMEVLANEPSGSGERFRTQVMGGSLPDCANWEGFTFSEYYTYVDQELLRPMPDGWEETYPNIAKMVQSSGYADYLKVDGKTYAIPHVIFDNFVEMNPPLNHASLFIRKDWAAEVGMPNLGDGHKLKLSELKEYLEAVKAAGLTEDGAFLSGNAGNLTLMFTYATGAPYRTFVKTDNGYEYTLDSQKDKWINLIETMREWFKAGLIDPDYIVVNDIYDARAAIMAGTLAAMYDSGDCGNTNTYMTGYQENFADRDAYEDLYAVQILTDEGESNILEVGNYWTVQVFNPEVDDAKMAKILEVMDWACSPEGEVSTMAGIPEVDWKFGDDGKVETINTVSIENYPSTDILNTAFSHCQDELGYSGARSDMDQRAIDSALAVFDVKKAGHIIPYEKDYEIYSSPTKDVYSVDYQQKINELVVSDDDIAAAWDAFLDENKGMWQPLLDELNAQ